LAIDVPLTEFEALVVPSLLVAIQVNCSDFPSQLTGACINSLGV
jgi:hypothetical protein